MRPAPASRRRRAWRDAAALGTTLALGAFVVAILLASAHYPGGSWTAPAAPGFSLLRNFWCDLLRGQAINGADNASARRFASIGFAALGVGLWPYWWVAASVLEPPLRRRVLHLGTASATALAAMAALPSDRFPISHGVVALSGALFGMAAAGASVAARSQGEGRFALRRVAGVLTLAFAGANALLYVYVAYLHAPETLAQPIVQKIATLLLVIWMLSTVQQARRLA